MSILKAREIIIPNNLPELLDERGGAAEGTFRDHLANLGELQPEKFYRRMLRTMIQLEFKQMMASTMLPGQPMSKRRFSDVMFALSTAYVLGTMTVTEKGDFSIGDKDDTKFVMQALAADKFELRNGKVIPGEIIVPVLTAVTGEDAIGFVYDDIAKKGLFTRKEIPTKSAGYVAQFLLDTIDGIMDSSIWEAMGALENLKADLSKLVK